MILSKESLPIVTFFRESVCQHSENQVIVMFSGFLSHQAEHRGINAILVILDSISLDANGSLEILIFDGVAVLADMLDLSVPDPFLHARDLSKPCVVVCGSAGSSHSCNVPVVLAYL